MVLQLCFEGRTRGIFTVARHGLVATNKDRQLSRVLEALFGLQTFFDKFDARIEEHGL